MTTSTKEIRSIDLVNADLVKALRGTLNEDALAVWFDSAVEMLEAQKISVRGLKATIEEADVWLAPSKVQYFKNGAKVRALKGGEKQTIKKILTTTEDAKRAFGEDFEAKLESAKSFADFAKQIPPREKATRGAGTQNSSEKELDKISDLDGIFSFIQGALDELEGDALIVRKIAEADKVLAKLAQFVRNSKAVNHPAGKVA